MSITEDEKQAVLEYVQRRLDELYQDLENCGDGPYAGRISVEIEKLQALEDRHMSELRVMFSTGGGLN